FSDTLLIPKHLLGLSDRNTSEPDGLANAGKPEVELVNPAIAADPIADFDTRLSTSAADLVVKRESWSCGVAPEIGAIAQPLDKFDLKAIAQSTEADDSEDAGSTVSAEADANNPLANMTAVNFQNYYIGDLTGPARDANQFVLRLAQPVELFDTTWLIRASIPVNTFPTASLDTKTGLGDINIFGAALIDTGNPALSVGVGPQITIPTATETNTGSDKWSVGIAHVLFDGRSPKFQWGYLLTYQHSFAGNPDRATVNGGAFQPFGFLQLGQGLYLRSAPIWAFDFESGNYNIPLGLGLGKVIQSGKTTYNFFVEPQYTVAHQGNNQPQWQIYFALNMQFR
ncbi:MAG: hypothetical protein AB4290_00300, partial [Spirulina sp.]